MKVYLYCVVFFIIIAFCALLYLFIERIRKNPCSTASDTPSCIDKEAAADIEKQKDSKKPSWGEYHATLMVESYRRSLQKRLRQKQFLKRHPETEQMIHSLKCIKGSIQGINNAVRKLSDNLCDLQKKIIELSELEE